MSAPGSPLRVLHVAALAFPTHQGTQASIAHMLEASRRVGHAAELFSYAAQGYVRNFAFPVHRTGKLPWVSSLRSGPSLAKLGLDLRMGVELRALCGRLQPQVVVAHHVEAASLALTVCSCPVVFFAHADLEGELPVYGPQLLRPVLAAAGRALDQQLTVRADAVAAISPDLQQRLAALGSQTTQVDYVPTPWPAREPITAALRAQSREQLRLPPRAKVLLYAGNLDAYQGIDVLLAAVRMGAERSAELHWLVATQSDTSALRADALRAGLAARLHISDLHGEQARARVHAAADVAVVPRRSPGGLPIKLLEALSRGVPCAAMPHACAGLPLAHAVSVAHDESAEALRAAMERLLHDSAHAERSVTAGRKYIAHEHNDERFAQALGRIIGHALARRR